jgi:uncharacterized membrane protein YoaK (UPF0700 family)
LLPFVLSTTAGAVDVTGFLALDGLFTAHITGNLVVLAVHYTTGGFCEVGPLLAVPVFVVVLGAVTLVSRVIEKSPPRRALLVLHVALLAGSLGLGAGFGPFANADTPMAVLVGMLGVAAMATQNALVRLALPGTPSTAVMTTNITQLTVDLATLIQSRGEPGDLALARHRASATFLCILGFVTGCIAGAVLEVRCGLWALALPVGLAAAAIPLGELRGDSPVMAARRMETAGGHGASARTTVPDNASDLGQQISGFNVLAGRPGSLALAFGRDGLPHSAGPQRH